MVFNYPNIMQMVTWGLGKISNDSNIYTDSKSTLSQTT